MKRAASYRDQYPTGYKHCSYCKRWRPVSDFGVREWADEPRCTVPRLLASMCVRCMAERRRIRTGGRPRSWYPFGTPGSERHNEHRRAQNRATRAERWKDPEYVATVNEYQRIWRHAKLGRITSIAPEGKSRHLCDPKPFLEWLDGRADPSLTEGERQTLQRVRDGKIRRLDLGVVDRIMTRNDSADQFFIYYPPDEDLSTAA